MAYHTKLEEKKSEEQNSKVVLQEKIELKHHSKKYCEQC